MISAAKLHQLSNINADQLTDLLVDGGYTDTDEPIINTHFDGVSVGTENLYFHYQAAYAHVDGGLQFADIVVTYHIDSGKLSAYIGQ
jgi:hypothetical protein